ncbi:glycosyltransferase family 4 protein [Nisaea sediminum]|uniref:glycosyltransferase family 4 protein n=1 Tax=Nisaea sediminum TaxID=2775867 RepID=UPI001868B9D6|nr:glycosyltransferase family 4 protein [Nisaea sediminum]
MFRHPAHEKKPVVLQVLPALVSGGVERGTIDVANALVQAGWDALVVSAGGPMVHELTRVGARHIEHPLGSKNPMSWRQNFDWLVDVIHNENVDIVHARSRMPAWIAWRAARKNKVPFVTTFHGRFPDTNPLKKVYNSVMVRGDRVIAISHFIASEIERRFGTGSDKLRIIPRGVNTDLFDPDGVSAERMIKLSREWRLPDGVPVVVLPGRVTRWKGHEVLIEALTRLGDQPVHCIMVGSYEGKESYKAELEEKIAKAGLTASVMFTGAARDLPCVYKIADVVVSASIDPEPFGRVMIEAQAMGRPIVATDHGGARESVLPGETGFLVTPNDPDALAAGIRWALSLTSNERATLSEKAIAHAREHYTTRDMCLRTLSVYEEVLPLSPNAGK